MKLERQRKKQHEEIEHFLANELERFFAPIKETERRQREQEKYLNRKLNKNTLIAKEAISFKQSSLCLAGDSAIDTFGATEPSFYGFIDENG